MARMIAAGAAGITRLNFLAWDFDVRCAGMPVIVIAGVGIFPVVTDPGRPLLNGCDMSALLDAEIRVHIWAD
jgi:hypothetical protein